MNGNKHQGSPDTQNQLSLTNLYFQFKNLLLFLNHTLKLIIHAHKFEKPCSLINLLTLVWLHHVPSAHDGFNVCVCVCLYIVKERRGGEDHVVSSKKEDVLLHCSLLDRDSTPPKHCAGQLLFNVIEVIFEPNVILSVHEWSHQALLEPEPVIRADILLQNAH